MDYGKIRSAYMRASNLMYGALKHVLSNLGALNGTLCNGYRYDTYCPVINLEDCCNETIQQVKVNLVYLDVDGKIYVNGTLLDCGECYDTVDINCEPIDEYDGDTCRKLLDGFLESDLAKIKPFSLQSQDYELKSECIS